LIDNQDAVVKRYSLRLVTLSTRRYRVTVLTVCLLFLSQAVMAQSERFTPCSPSDKYIELKISAKTIPATASLPERRVWVVTELPNADQIVVAPGDTVLQSSILEIIQTIRDAEVEVGVGKAGNRQPGDPFPLELQLADLDSVRPDFELILPGGLTAAPQVADLDQVYTVRLCLQYTVPRPPSKVEFSIATAKGAANPLPGIPSFTLADAAERFRTSPAGTIPIQLAYAQQDIQDAQKDPAITTEADAVKRVQAELLRVAAFSFDQSREQGLLSDEGVPLVDRSSGGTVAANIESKIIERYDLNGLDPKVKWGAVKARVNVRDLTPQSPWLVTVSGLEFAQQVDIEVVKNAIETEFDGTSTEKKFDARREAIRERILTAHASSLLAKPGRIVTTADIANDKAQLRDDKNVKSIEGISSGPTDDSQKLLYFVSRHLKAEKVLSLKLGAGYSPEEHLTGNVALDETNLLGIAEVSKLSYSGGPQTQKVKFTLDRAFEIGETGGWRIKSLGVNVQYFTDKDKRFSNLTADEIAANETGSTAQISFGYDSFSLLDQTLVDCLSNKDRKRTRLSFQATPVFAFRDVNIKNDDLLLTVTKLDPALLPQARTQATTLTLDSTLGFSHDFRRPDKAGAGQLNITFQGRLQRGFRFFGADYSYNKTSATIAGEFLFGVASPRDFMLRYNRTMSTATHGTPVFELNRLGGPLTVRGLEEGEFIGRKLSADQFDVGVALLSLWNFIRRKSNSELLKTSCDEEGQPALPIDFKNTYLKVFYDRGRIKDRDSFTPGPVTRVAQGYGVAVELRKLGGQNINLSIGYAYSPESTLHRKGTSYTGVTYAF
jgi:hypothetical protein